MAFRVRTQGSLTRILKLLKPFRKRIFLGLFIIFCTQILRMFFPRITREIVNVVIPNRDFALLLRLSALILGLTAARAFGLYRRGLLFERVSQDVVYQLRTELYARFQAQSNTFYDQHRIGEIMSRMTGDMEGLRNFIINMCMVITEQMVMFVAAMLFMGDISWTLTLVILAVNLPLAVFATVFNKKIRPAHSAIREQNAVLNTRTQENIAGVRVVKAFTREADESREFEKDNEKVLKLNMNATYIWSNFNPIVDFVGALAVPAMLLVGGNMVSRGTLDLGSLIAATGYVWMLVNPMRMLVHYVNIFAQGVTSAEKLFYYLDLGSIVRDPERAEEPASREGAVQFDNVTMAYGDAVILRNISFEAKPGETVAVMGGTGSGKTTLVNLIGRFYDIQSGSVTVDGVDVRRQSLSALRASIGYVMQDTFLFSDTISENIAFGNPALPHGMVERAAELAQAKPFITHMPHGWDTIVGERGLGLSGGQKQRVAIARALAYDPKILILDDATSAVDMETEAIIQEQLREVLGQRTTFIIAHRISSVIHADQILVLDNGVIAERGSHAALLAKQGLYYQMFMDQVRDFADLGTLREA